MKKKYVIVEHRNYRVLDDKNKVISQLKSQLVQLRKRCDRAERDYGHEVMINSYLIDVLKRNKISYQLPR